MNTRIVIGGSGPKPLTVSWIQRGEFVDAPSSFSPGGTERMMVLTACGDLFHVYFCETCRANFANQGQLEMHFEQGGHHRIAVWCSKRGVYEAAAPLALNVNLFAGSP